ncbi:hypothetical protein CEXT_678071 [Caerostris extrusa]|uniref:Uncharacterized protein n=1 Tax=Caerostris extrusa TaxID=172846 RepID=A0AAV4TKQ6_CAEEX|nr:hypothetical protein CEXT_678071 [Caerostris extrusa]
MLLKVLPRPIAFHAINMPRHSVKYIENNSLVQMDMNGNWLVALLPDLCFLSSIGSFICRSDAIGAHGPLKNHTLVSWREKSSSDDK